jgi:mono/diheme cytochrome c family protein
MNKLLYVARYAATTAILLATVYAHAQASDAAPRSASADKQPSPAARASLAAGANDHPVTAVTGESWINHLNRQLGNTSMGKTGRLGPPPPAPGDGPPRGEPAPLIGCATQSTTLHGADLYRLNCRGCHGEAGLGAPPEINSVIDPLRGTSVPLVMERMKKSGVDMTRSEATQLAQQAQAALVQRFHVGGKAMPPFPQLNDAEIRSIIAYLRQLAGIPGAEKEQVAVSESPIRMGELIMKSTCHTCHSATGPNPSPQQLLDGAIPPLETLTARKDQSGLIQKVTQGAPIIMGTPPTATRGRMPVFYYLSPEEAADVYLYLTLYPPSELSILDSVAPAQAPPTPRQPDQAATGAPAQTEASGVGPELPQPGSRAEIPYTGLAAGAGLWVTALVAVGLGFTFWQFSKPSPRAAPHALATPALGTASTEVGNPAATKQGRCRTIPGRGKGKRHESPAPDEAGGLARKNRKGGRQCNGTRLS